MIPAQRLQDLENVITAVAQRAPDALPSRCKSEGRVGVVHVGEALEHRASVADGVSVARVDQRMEGGPEGPLHQVGKLRAEELVDRAVSGRQSRGVVTEEGVVVDPFAQNIVGVRLQDLIST